MRRISVGQKLYVGVIAVFLVFATTFIVYQHAREKQYKIDALTIRLQDFNDRMDDELHDQPAMTEAALALAFGRKNSAVQIGQTSAAFRNAPEKPP